MKECKYCGTQCKNDIEKCPNCGGNKFYTEQEIAIETQTQSLDRKNNLGILTIINNNPQLGILVGIIATIVTIFVIVSYISNRPLSNGMSQAEGNEILEQGELYFEDGNYSAAIESLTKLPEDSRQYSKAKDILDQSKSAYVSSVLEKVNANVENGNYDKAFSLIDPALSLLPDDSELLDSYEKIHEEYRNEAIEITSSYINNNEYTMALEYLSKCIGRFPNDAELESIFDHTLAEYHSKVKSEAINNSATSASINDYANVIVICRNALSVVGKDEEISAILSNYESLFEEKILQEASSLYIEYNAQSIYSAEEVIQNALKVLPGNGRLSDELARYKDLEPIEIITFPVVDPFWNEEYDGKFSTMESACDTDGIEYKNIVYVERMTSRGVDTSDIGYREARRRIDLDYQYSRITGTLFQNEKYKTAPITTKLEIGEANTAYDSMNSALWSGYVSCDTGAKHFSVDVTGKKFIEICFFGDLKTLINQDKPYDYAYVSEFYLWK